MFPKFSSPSDFDFGIESVSIITDSKSLTKRASAKELLKYEKTPGQTDVHIIAVGAYEGTGFNRNLDAFKAEDCAKNCHYFKDADRAFNRHHRNKPEDPKFGNIKAAAYNVPMKRIELIVAHDDDKCQDILGEIEKKGQANYSMASRQQWDRCSWCDFKAYSDDTRCEHIPTKLGQINKYGSICGMINDNPQWFEISYVARPADRIGMSLAKLASELHPMLPSDYLKIYTGFQMPVENYIISKKAADKRALLKKLSEMEKHLDMVATNQVKDSYLLNEAPKLKTTDKVAFEVIDAIRKFEPSRVFKYAADKGIIFSPDNFVQYIFGKRVKQASIDGMKTHLPNIYTQLYKDASEVINNETYEPAYYSSLEYDGRQELNKIASINSDSVRTRLINATLSNKNTEVLKSASSFTVTNEVLDKELANQYATYKLAALNYMDQNNRLDDSMTWSVLVQNR